MENPFINVHVQPTYGRNRAGLTWQLKPGYSGGDFYVFKSFNNGLAPWLLINEIPVRGLSFVDEHLDMSNSVPYYRVLMVLSGKEYDSPIVTPLDKLSKTQFGGVSRMMQLEYMRMSTGNGVQVLHYIPLENGAIADDTDPITLQKYGSHCQDKDLNDIDYGQKFKGGFTPPIYTWLEISQYGVNKVEEDQQNLAMTWDITHKARMLAFPKPSPGDLVIQPDTDIRYGIISPVQGNYFRGAFPISFDVGLQVLNNADPRYGIPVPEVLPKPFWAKYD